MFFFNHFLIMWDLKLILLDSLFYCNFRLLEFFFHFTNVLDPLLLNGLSIMNLKTTYIFVYNSSFFFGIKFLLSIGFLILIRGGTPRYRYDYLTKLGWLRFIGLVVLVFLISLFIFFLF